MWAQPWAWLGLAGLAVPVAIHLLARHQAVRAAFPTLRFIDASELNAIKRQRLTDIPLLLVRLLIIALAVAAVAGPRIGASPIAADSEPAHVTVYDMTESAAAGRTDSYVSMRRRAHIRTESLHAGIEAAVAWAVRQPGEREITIVSDFQRGALDDAAVRLVPKGVGLRFERVRSTPKPLPPGLEIGAGDVRMTWPALPAEESHAIAVLAGSEQAVADAMLSAALSVVPLNYRVEESQVLVVFPKAPEREALLASMKPVNEPWMFDFVKRLHARTPVIGRIGTPTVMTSGPNVIVAIDAAPDSPDAVETVASLAAALTELPPVSESDPRTIDDAQLKSWERPVEPAIIEREGEPQGRWLWMGVLLLLAIETWMRRRAA